MYKYINNYYSNIHNDPVMLRKYNELPVTVKLLHASYAVLSEEFSGQHSIIGQLSVIIYDDILDYDLDDVLLMQPFNTSLLTAITILINHKEFENYTQISIYKRLSVLLKNTDCQSYLDNAIEVVKEYN